MKNSFKEHVGKPLAGLHKELSEKRKELAALQQKNKLGEVKKHHEIGVLKRTIAHLSTAISQQGVN